MKVEETYVRVMKGRGSARTYRNAACEGVECRGLLTEELSGRHAAWYVMLLRSVTHGRTENQ